MTFLGGSHSEAMDVNVQVGGNGVMPNGSDGADLADDLQAFLILKMLVLKLVETTSSINTTASLWVFDVCW